MSSSDKRKGLDWSLIIAAVVGGVIALVAAFASGYWKTHTDAQATKSAQSRLVRGSVRAWRDDLYDAEDLIGYAIEKRRWTAERDPPLAGIEDYKEVSRAASWETWRFLSTARDDLNHLYLTWRRPRRLDHAGVESLKAVLISLERARLKLARELDDGEPGPAPHPIFHEAGLKYPRGQVEIR
jgi:hypothetical protein